MNILLSHTNYLNRGGEESVVANELELLHSHGHKVDAIFFSNEDFVGAKDLLNKTKLAAQTVWSRATSSLLRKQLQTSLPDVVHFHNWFPNGSPALHAASRGYGSTVVQTLHNYRLLCPNALFFRDGRLCEDCLGRFSPWPGVVHKCYRESHSESCVTAVMLTFHQARRTWHRDVDRFVALTEFSRKKFIEGGLPADRIRVKPNFLDRPTRPRLRKSEYFLFVGRLIDYKGIGLLHPAWAKISGNPPLHIVGDGPARDLVRESTTPDGSIQLLGALPNEETMRQFEGALALLVPSLLYENFPMTIVEAFASGVAVIASRLGAMAEIVEDGKTGLLFEPSDVQDLAAKVEWAWDHPQEMLAMGANAREEYERHYTAERNYEILMDIYQEAIEHRKANPPSRWPK
jgi:glycosyltransferase involved in cell wall biosynthesis